MVVVVEQFRIKVHVNSTDVDLTISVCCSESEAAAHTFGCDYKVK